MRPINRLRSTTSIDASTAALCSNCASSLNLDVSVSGAPSAAPSRLASRATSQISINVKRSSIATIRSTAGGEEQCKICLESLPTSAMVRLRQCGCSFCRECMLQYVAYEVAERAYDISCPDPECVAKGELTEREIEAVAGADVAVKHRAVRLDTEVALDRNRTWCPAPDCGTVCHICPSELPPEGEGLPVHCPKCNKEFCSLCSANYHPGKTCRQNGQELVRQVNAGPAAGDAFLILEDFDGDIKPCPMCNVPIERDAGCAQMMCKRCKHVFCWYCLTSLDVSVTSPSETELTQHLSIGRLPLASLRLRRVQGKAGPHTSIRTLPPSAGACERGH